MPKKKEDMKAKMAKTSDFDAWAEDAKKKPQSAHIWDSWPDEMKEEIAKVLEMNDSGRSAPIPQTKMLERMLGAYQIECAPSTLTRYCKSVLGRAGWRIR